MTAAIAAQPDCAITAADRLRLRGLASRYARLAGGEANRRRIEAWSSHNRLEGGRPLILVFPEGSWSEIGPAGGFIGHPDRAFNDLCWWFWEQLWLVERIGADNALQPWLPAPRRITSTGWGLQEEWTHSREARGARTFKPVLTSPDDIGRIVAPVIDEDREASARTLAMRRELVGDILPVHQVGVQHISFHLMAQYTAWRGLEEMMLDLVSEPDLVHAAMRRLADGHHRVLDQYRDQGLLTANADNTYHSSGGNGWCGDLPAGPQPGCLETMWGSAESQELAAVGPRQHRAFALVYEAELLARFARTGYGCCEALHHKLPDLLQLVPNIRRVSISPWADVPRSARQLAGRRAILSWKPNPAQLVGAFDEVAIRDGIRAAVAACREHDCQLEIVLKDTHTCEQRPERFARWTELCREAIAAVWGPEA